jgi:hypothetical protein
MPVKIRNPKAEIRRPINAERQRAAKGAKQCCERDHNFDGNCDVHPFEAVAMAAAKLGPEKVSQLIAGAHVKRAKEKRPRMRCPECGKPAVFIRDRGFPDGSGLVFTCRTDGCKNELLYFYPSRRRANYRPGDYKFQI